MRTPDVLVLGGGGTLGEAWMSAVLAGAEADGAFAARDCGCFIGTSAGSIVAASLAAGHEPAARLGDLPPRSGAEQPQQASTALRQAFGAAAQIAGSAAAPLASLAFASTAPGGALLRRAALSGVRPGKRSLAELGRMVAAAGVSFDGRLRIVAVDVESGRRVVFGAPAAPAPSVAAAVEASCAIPGFFRPVEIAGRTYVDGGVWSPTNIDAADVEEGTRVLCLNPTGSLRPTRGAPAGAIGPLSRGLAAGEAVLMRGRGASVRIVNPDAASSAAIGTNLMDERRRRAVIDAGHAQGLALAVGTRRAA